MKGGVSMKLSTVKTMTTILLAFSFILTVLFAVFTIVIGVLSRALPPIVIFSLFTVAFIFVDIFYVNSRKALNEGIEDGKKLRQLKRQNLTITAIMFTFAFSLFWVLFGMIVIYRLIHPIELYYLIITLITAFYSFNGISLYNTLFKKQ